MSERPTNLVGARRQNELIRYFLFIKARNMPQPRLTTRRWMVIGTIVLAVPIWVVQLGIIDRAWLPALIALMLYASSTPFRWKQPRLEPDDDRGGSPGILHRSSLLRRGPERRDVRQLWDRWRL
ncbi:MAG: hypothetical protein ACYC61_07585 [Isosphaeraceae bacterium]